MALMPSVVDAVDPIPVIAAGGISDGRGLLAALMPGAQAAWMGTRSRRRSRQTLTLPTVGASSTLLPRTRSTRPASTVDGRTPLITYSATPCALTGSGRGEPLRPTVQPKEHRWLTTVLDATTCSTTT